MADMVFVAAYPPDTVGIISAAREVKLTPKMFGGTLVGLLVTPIKMRLGPLMDGMVIMESFVPAPGFDFPGLKDVFAKYRTKAAIAAAPLSLLTFSSELLFSGWR